MDIKKIKKLVEIFEKSNITELEVSEGKNNIRISCLNGEKNFINPDYLKCDSKSLQNISDKPKDILQKGHIVRSPMVGIFYITPNENAKPFIEVGKKVKNGDILCIVEAMKMMNQIISEKSGLIKEIFIENGQPVEFDEPLLIIE